MNARKRWVRYIMHFQHFKKEIKRIKPYVLEGGWISQGKNHV